MENTLLTRRHSRPLTSFTGRLLGLLVLLLLGTFGARAQNRADAYGFTQTNGTYTPLTGGTVVATATAGGTGATALDDVIYSATIPFTFTYAGMGYTSVNISTNGFITFGTTPPAASTYTPISTGTAYAGAVSALGRDAQGNAGATGPLGEIRTGTMGSAFVVQYSNFQRFGGSNAGDNFNFQIRLNQGSNTIDIVYGAFTFAGTSSTTAQVGLRGAATTDYNNRTFVNTASLSPSFVRTNVNTSITSSSTVTLTGASVPPSGLTYTFTPSTTTRLPAIRPLVVSSSITATAATVSFTAPTPAPTNYTATVTNATTGAAVGSPLTVTASPFSLTGLTADTDYKVSIVANYAAGTSLPTEVYFRSAANCAAPTALAISNNTTGNSATLTFTAPASGVSSYTVTYQAAGGSVQTVSPNPTASPVSLTGLTPGTAYTVTVVSNCTAGGTSAPATVSFTTVTPPPVNDNPSGAIAIPITADCTSPTQGTNAGATTTPVNGYTNPGCGIASSPKDVWYTFTTAATGPTATAVQINITGNPAGQVRVFSTANGAAGPFTEIACSAGSNNNVVAPDFSFGGLTPSTTYYIFVSGYGSGDTQGAFTLCVTNPPACGDPTNAVVTIGATTISVAFTPGPGNTSFTFTATPTAGGTPITNSGTASPIQVSGLTPNTSYDLSLVANCAGGLTTTPIGGTFTTNALPPANDECAGAISLTSSATCVPTSGTTNGATASTAAGTCVGTADDDVWYSFVATNTTHTITVVGATGFDAVLNLRSGACPGVNVGSCKDGSGDGGMETITSTSLTVGDTYYVRVYHYFTGSGSGDFTICVTEPAACAAPTAVATNTVTSTSANVTFTAGNGNTGYTVTYTPTGGTALTATGTASPIALTGLTAGTRYSVTVTGNCAGGQTATSTPAVTFTTTALPPANDECANATVITCGQTVTGTTNGATTTGDPTGSCTGATVRAQGGVFYAFTGTGDIVTASTCSGPSATAGDTQLFVYSGSCGTFTCVGGNDQAGTAGCGTNTSASTVTFTSVAGTQYYVFVQGYFGPLDFGLTMTCVAPPACAPVTGLTAANVTTNSANLTFTAGNGNTSYTVTYTPAGGTAQTATGTASPIALTGLMPGTSYSVSVQPLCSGGGTSAPTTTTFTTTFPAPANDLCANATVLTCGQTVTGTTQGATTTGAPTGSCGGTTPTAQPGVFYSYMGTGDIVTVSTCSGPTGVSGGGDTKLFVLGGTCSALTCVGGNDDAGTANCTNSLASTVTFTSVAGTQYYFYVQGFSSTLPFGLSVTCVAPTCNAPTNLMAGSITQTTASVSFTAGTGNTGFTATATPQGGGTAVTGTGTASPIALTGLVAGTTYNLSLQAVCSGGGTTAAVTTTFTTTAAPCNAPTALASSAITNTSATVSFTGSGSATGYTVTTSPVTTPQTLGASATSASFTGLTPGTAYTVSIVSNCAGGVNSSPATTTFTTTSVCNAATALTTSAITTSSATVSFTGSSSATSYTVTTVPVTTTQTLAAGATSVGFTGLSANTSYAVSIRSNCAGGLTAAASTSFTTQASACAAPGTPSFASITQTSASVSFTPSASNVGPYTVTYTPAGGTAQTVSGAGSPISLTGLMAGTSYSVTVTGTCNAASGGGASPASAAAMLTTTAAPCNAPTNLTASSITQATASVNFTAGTGNTNFTATATPQGGGTAVTGTGTASPIALTGLVAGTTYNLSLQAVCSGGGTTAAVTTTFTTTAAPCNAPTALSAGSITSSSATVSFTGSSSATGYTVTTSPATTTQTLAASATSVSFSGLMASTSYTVSIVSNCAAGATSSAATVSFTTTAAALTDLVVTNGQNISANGPYNNITVQSGGTLTLNGATSAAGTATVQNGGTLFTNCQVLSGSGTFTLAAGGTLGICSPAGITASGATGAIQVTGTRSYASDASYIYNGTVAQITGSGLPATVRNLTVNNAAGLSLSQGVSITQVARLQNGNLNTSAHPFTLLSDANGTALVDNTGGLVTGTGTMQRAVTNAVTGPAYRHFSSPVANTTLSDLTTPGFAPTFNPLYNTSATPSLVTPFPTVFGYDQARVGTVTSTYGPFDQGWFSPASGSDPMVPTRGYTANAPATAVPVDFVGTFNNAAQNSGALLRGANAESGWQFLGNPYPSPLDWSTVTPAQRPGMDAAMYVYQSTGQYAGVYRSYTNGMGTSPLIDAGSGYFGRVSTTGTSGAVNLANANRVTTFGPEPVFGRGTADTRPQLHLLLTNAAQRDEAYFYFEAGATAGADAQYDAVKLANPSGFDLASLSGTTPLAINGLAPLTTTDVVVPLTVRVPQAGSFTFEVADLANFGAATVYLRDALTGTQQVLTAGTRYTFTLATATAGTGRFSVVFRPAAVTATAPGLSASTVSVYPNPVHSGTFTLLLPPLAGQPQVQATLLNALGQVVLTRTIGLNAAGATAEFNTALLATGVYTLRLQAHNAVLNKRLVIE